MDVDPGIISKFLLLLILVCVSAFFASSESALFSLGRFRIRRLKRKGPKAYGSAKALLETPTKLIASLLIGNEFANAAIGVVGSSLVYQLFEGRVQTQWMPVLAIALVLPFLLLVGEIIPKTLGIKHAVSVSALNAHPLFLFSKWIRPLRDAVIWGPEKLLKLISPGKKDDNSSVSEDVFRAMVDVGAEEGVLDDQEQKLIHNVLRLDDIKITKIMTPFSKFSYLLANESLDTAMKKIHEDSYSRYPVLNEKRNEVLGVLYAKDLLSIEAPDRSARLVEISRQALLIKPQSNALELFAQFKINRMHFGIVVEGKHILGLVTLEDVLEEVFGAIRDERDMEDEA